MFLLTYLFLFCLEVGYFLYFKKKEIDKNLVFCELCGDHIEVFLHCAEGKTDSLASTFTMPLYSKSAQESSQRGEWADNDNLCRTGRNLVTH